MTAVPAKPKRFPLRVGLTQVDEVVVLDASATQGRPKHVFGAGARRYGIAEEDEIIDLTDDDGRMTIGDLGSVTNSPARFPIRPNPEPIVAADRWIGTQGPASSHLIINPVHHGPISTARIQTAKRDFAASFATYSASPLSQSHTRVDHPESDHVDVPSKRVRTKLPSPIPEVVSYQPSRTRIDFAGTSPATLCTSRRVPALLFNSKAGSARIVNVQHLLNQKFGDSALPSPTDRAFVKLTRPCDRVAGANPNAVLSQINAQYDSADPSSNTISIGLLRSIQPFSFSHVATLFPVHGRSRIILDLLGVLLDSSSPSELVPMTPLEQSAKTLNTSYRLQRWLTHLLSGHAKASADNYIQAGQPLAAIRVLMESRQLVAACDVAARHKMHGLALVLSSAAVDPDSAHKHLSALMHLHPHSVPADYVKSIQLAALCLVEDGEGQKLPEWTTEAVAGLSFTQAMLHILAAMPLMPMTQIVSQLATIEPILHNSNHGSLDAVLLDIMVLASCKETCAASAKNLMWTVADEISGDVMDWVALVMISAGLVAHGYQIDTQDYSKLVTRASGELERLGYWDLALSVLQLSGLVDGRRDDTSRALVEILVRNVSVELGPAESVPLDHLLPHDRWVVEHCNVSFCAMLEAKSVCLDTYISSSVLAMPRPGTHSSSLCPKPSTLSSFLSDPSVLKVPVRMSRRFGVSKSDLDRTLEHDHALRLLSMAAMDELTGSSIGNLSPSAFRIALRALRWLVPECVLGGDFKGALAKIGDYERLVSTAAGKRALPGGLGRPVVMDVVQMVEQVVQNADGPDGEEAVRMARKLCRMMERRVLELSLKECGAIRFLLVHINSVAGIHVIPNIMAKPSASVDRSSMDLS